MLFCFGCSFSARTAMTLISHLTTCLGSNSLNCLTTVLTRKRQPIPASIRTSSTMEWSKRTMNCQNILRRQPSKLKASGLTSWTCGARNTHKILECQQWRSARLLKMHTDATLRLTHCFTTSMRRRWRTWRDLESQICAQGCSERRSSLCRPSWTIHCESCAQ